MQCGCITDSVIAYGWRQHQGQVKARGVAGLQRKVCIQVAMGHEVLQLQVWEGQMLGGGVNVRHPWSWRQWG